MILECFFIDRLSISFLILLFLINSQICFFSRTYLEGQKAKKDFFIYLLGLTCALCFVFTANHLCLFWCAWVFSQFFIICFLRYQADWQAAKESAILAKNNFFISALFLAVSFMCLFLSSHSLYIQDLVFDPGVSGVHPVLNDMSMVALILSAAAQSAFVPCHQWLLSSLNAPSPVSALMHGGFLASGFFVILRFYPICSQAFWIYDLIFFIGIVTLLSGAFWKLVQTNVKSMLVCSTIAQMGYALMQIGAGLFSYALAHMMMHAFFKTYLFLGTSSASDLNKKYVLSREDPSKRLFFCVLISILATSMFTIAAQVDPLSLTTELLIVIFVFFGVFEWTESVYDFFEIHTWQSLVCTVFLVGLTVCLYGIWVKFLEGRLSILNFPQSLRVIHMVFMMIGLSIFIIFKFFLKFISKNDWFTVFYVSLVNSSRPHKKTIQTIF